MSLQGNLELLRKGRGGSLQSYDSSFCIPAMLPLSMFWLHQSTETLCCCLLLFLCWLILCDCAKNLLVSFVEHFGKLYGEGFLVHLSDDVKRHGCIEGISGFPFENFLGEVKHMVRGPNFPVAQVVCQLSEHNQVHYCQLKARTVLRKEYIGGPLPQGVRGGKKEFKELHMDQFCVKITEG